VPYKRQWNVSKAWWVGRNLSMQPRCWQPMGEVECMDHRREKVSTSEVLSMNNLWRMIINEHVYNNSHCRRLKVLGMFAQMALKCWLTLSFKLLIKLHSTDAAAIYTTWNIKWKKHVYKCTITNVLCIANECNPTIWT